MKAWLEAAALDQDMRGFASSSPVVATDKKGEIEVHIPFTCKANDGIDAKEELEEYFANVKEDWLI